MNETLIETMVADGEGFFFYGWPAMVVWIIETYPYLYTSALGVAFILTIALLRLNRNKIDKGLSLKILTITGLILVLLPLFPIVWTVLGIYTLTSFEFDNYLKRTKNVSN